VRGPRWHRAQANDEKSRRPVVEIRTAEPEGRGRRGPGSSRRGKRLLGAGLAAVAILAAAATFVPLALHDNHRPAASPTPSLSVGPSDNQIAQNSATPVATLSRSSSTPTPATTDSPPPTPSVVPAQSYEPIHISGWPAKWLQSVSGGAGLTLGSDGTLYLAGASSLDPAAAIAIDKAGHQKVGWARLPDGRTVVPTAFGSDGTIYSTDTGDGYVTNVYAFGPDGKLKAGWPVELPDWVPLLPGPSGTLYATTGDQLVVFGPDGKVKATSSPAPGDLCVLQRAVIRPDGTLFVLCGTDSTQSAGSIAVFDSTAKKLAGASADLWDGIAMGANGQVVAWRNETVRVGETGFAPQDTILAALGTDGRPLKGWLKSVGGPASTPVVSSDGSVYIAIETSERESPSQIIAFNADGTIKAGWPHSLPDGTVPDGTAPRMDSSGQPGVPLYPVPPLLGSDGTVYWVVDDPNGTEYVLAWDSSGRALPGWPVTLPQPIQTSLVGPCSDWCGPDFDKPVFVKPISGPARLYFHLNDTILALTEDGKVASGWPKKLEANGSVFYGWSWWSVTPDGGVVALEQRQLETDNSFVLTRWNADGSVAH
jgi:hypothetical protein